MRSLNVDDSRGLDGNAAPGELEPEFEAFITFLGFSGIFGDELATENPPTTPNKDVTLSDTEALCQQDKLILAKLWDALIFGLVTDEQIQALAGMSLLELEHLAIVEPGCLQGIFVTSHQ